MGVVRKITDRHARAVKEALEVMMRKNRLGRIPAFLFIAEEIGNPHPLLGMVGRFRTDPSRAIGHLAVMKAKVIELAANDAPDV